MVGIIYAIELIVCVVYCFFMFFRRDKTWNKVVRVILASVQFFINVAEILMEIQMETSYERSIVHIVIWFILAVMNSFELGKDRN